jgi:hypothetical protein
LWPPGAADRYGQPSRGEPVEIRVRWLSGQRAAAGPDGGTIMLDGSVVADREIAQDSLMWLGTLEEWNESGSAPDDSELMRVVYYRATPDIKGRATRRVVDLMRFRQALPAEEE